MMILSSSSLVAPSSNTQIQSSSTLVGSSTMSSPTNPASSNSASAASTQVANPPQSNIFKNLVRELSENLNVNGEEFVKEDFDTKSFTSAILKTNLLSDHLAKLSQNINTLDKEIREQVSIHHEDLLHQAINIETLEEMLDMIQTRISSLKSTSERLRIKIATPFNELNLRILQLSRLQAACDTLRRIKGILHHSTKLRAHMQAGVRDLVKSAQCLNELDFLLKDFDAVGIEIVENDVHFAYKARHEVEEQAQTILDKSMAHQDQTQLGTALQVFYSLGILTEKIKLTLKANDKNFQKISTELLDTTNLTLQSTASSASVQSSSSLASYNNPVGTPTGTTTPQFPGRVNMPNVGSMSQFRAQLWANMEKLMDLMYDSCSQIVILQQILEKKKDLLTNLFYVDEIDFKSIISTKMFLIDTVSSKQEAIENLFGPSGSSNSSDQIDSINLTNNSETGESTYSSSSSAKIITYDSICSVIDLNDINSKKSIEFLYDQWRCLTSALNSCILSACNQSNYIKQTFQNEYPKLLKLQNDLWLRLLQLNPLIDRYRYTNTTSSTISSSSSSATLSSQGSSANLTTSPGDKSKLKIQQQQQQSQNVQSKSPSAPLTYLSSYELLRKCFYDLENSYLNRSLSHLFDPINLIFSQSIDKQINRNDIDTYLKGIQSQLQTLQYDIFNSSASASIVASSIKTNNPNLTFSGYSSTFTDRIVANICKSIQMYANKSEQVLNNLNIELQQTLNSKSSSSSSNGPDNSSSGSNARSASPAIYAFASIIPSQIQMKNLEYVNVTHDLYEQLTRTFANEKLNKKLDDKLKTTLKSLLTFEENALNPFILSASDCILAIMLTMHQEDFANPQSQTCSLYVKELQQVLQRICRDYLQLYNCKHILNPYLNQLAVRCIDLFIRHASILRPMSDSARQRLVNDIQQIETIIQTILCPKLTDLGISYKQLKAFRHLLLTSSPYEPAEPSSLGEDIVDENHYTTVINESLSYHVLLHYLFSYAPTDLKSPHQSLDWSIARYSEWLDKHPNEKERLYVIKNSLEAYVNLVRQKNEKKFATIYPLMFRLLEKGLQALTTSTNF